VVADRLASRVRWLERHRRRIAIGLALVCTAFLLVALPHLLDSAWPLFHARLMAIVAGLVLAFVIEIALAGLLAWWELQLARAERSRGLPRATLRK
jgi:hypothetical protein